MNEVYVSTAKEHLYDALLSRQGEIQSRCFHPKNGFVEFRREEIEQSISARFEGQVKKYPDRLAIKTDLDTLTYNDLNRAANRVARAILAQQGEGEKPVALLFDHDSAMIVAIMGALKAGKIYVALDPSYPLARTTYILEDSETNLIVTNTKNLDLAQELARDKHDLLNVDEIDSDVSVDNLDLALSPDCIAYIIYTSGSTGTPKGVFQNHRNLLHNIMQYTNTLHLCRYDRFTLLYSCSVNGSLRDIFGALLNGASVHLYDVKTEGLAGLANWLINEEITFYHSVPTLFRYFVDTLTGEETFPNVRLIRFGGERVSRKNVNLYKKYFSDHCIMYTGMGSTETSTVRQVFIDKNTQIENSIIPTGFAVAERDVLLLDENDQEVGFGEVGQIAIRSPYLALGYWGQPELTQKKIKPDPAGSDARIYYTGDMGRFLSNGCLMHVGRLDFQVKVRGYRVEVTEIEMTLLEHEAIKESAVMTREDGVGNQRLVAYIVSQSEQTPTVSELNRFLKEKLPDHMIPSTFVSLDQMPLTPNGKVNRLALPEPGQVRPMLENAFVPPRDELEHQLAAIWADVLGMHPIGVTDNFFDLGGYSLLAMRLVAQIEAVTGCEVSLATLFHTLTIEKLAKTLCQKDKSSSFSALVALKTGGSKPPFFCVPGNMGNVFIDLGHLSRYLNPDRPFYGFQDSIHNFTKIETIAAHYLKEMRVIQPYGPYTLCGICWGAPVIYEMAQQLLTSGEQVALLVLVEPSRPWKSGLKPYLNFAVNTLGRFMQRFWYHSRNTTQLQSTTEREVYARLKLKVITNQWATRRYRPKPYSGPIHIVMGSESLKGSSNHRLDWRDWATQETIIYEIPGNHDTITGNNNTKIEEEPMRILAEQLRNLLD